MCKEFSLKLCIMLLERKWNGREQPSVSRLEALGSCRSPVHLCLYCGLILPVDSFLFQFIYPWGPFWNLSLCGTLKDSSSGSSNLLLPVLLISYQQNRPRDYLGFRDSPFASSLLKADYYLSVLVHSFLHVSPISLKDKNFSLLLLRTEGLCRGWEAVIERFIYLKSNHLLPLLFPWS